MVVQQIGIKQIFILLRMLQERLDHRDIEVWAIMAWDLWNARNKFYFENV